jgi:negative regulator of flagellin synthesis FlgM
MKIGQPADKPLRGTGPASAKTNGDAPAPAAGAAATGPSAKVLLSDTASTLLAGNEAVTGEFDKAKVERIANAIAQGRYVVDHRAIADKLIANAQELLGKTSH